MKIEQIYTGCLAQGAYYIESNGEVAIIDPLREVQPYIDMATKNNASITYIFETHFHADFVSGHVTLSKKTGAPIVYGPNANPTFDAIIAKDQQEFKVGNVTLVTLHTPGHTMESTTYLLKDENGEDYALFTGDTLFLGDVGRPDLAQKAADMTQDQLAATLYKSLRTKIMPLSNDLIIYPGHGAGSACGKNLSKETKGTLGDQKKNNYALRADMTEAEFVKEVTEGLLPPPQYFPLNVKMNKEGYEDIAEVIKQGTHGLSPEELEQLANEAGALVLDVRSQEEFAKGHIPQSIFIGIDGSFAPWVGALIGDVKQPIVLVIPEGREEETITRLSRVGFDNTLGYLKGGFKTWVQSGREYDMVRQITAAALETIINKETPVFDVRKNSEFLSERIEAAKNTPLDDLNNHLNEFPSEENFYIHCAGGYRSMIAASILKSRGIHNFVDIAGGFAKIKESTIPKTAYVCPSTL
ncbi:glyoxylase-like metal-dependent hydrolase (beta-lactamase superfamily II)/rhodanese-related sulfurtransferase [Wenyingzhuangia heitensis]|uniref:Glyoxylase-like metal-dependent hydrolase (Beta-lactamase superfamily II)/rhodanese-related sulfurtransferase n=1 Tax=Wenyingzhuangia heitensis TaxID=1487859 RepID=A0ABX0U6Z8_9FLAO|nr:MBL fold metallo-hydrolase [Wenyingzhuangia heitensis]NIJ44625.1 glyoxylase-like metal-dependent hydrolase (beta-lactamase superfamily II)/rhodanese-related sulfurtransferase [Wenyingzhuangia heitensis]